MALFTSQGMPVEIVAYCGKHRPKWAHKDAKLMLVLVRFLDQQGGEFYRWSTELRADGGINEVERLLEAAPERKLDKGELAMAMKEAD